MRCKTCDYPLWNLTTRQCPECGSVFRPGDFEFVPGSVRFCCPGCGQAYYGTDAKGHLVPRAFDCVTCGGRVDMDEMVLLPAEGVAEKDTIVGVNPWVDRPHLGWWKGLISTIGKALVMPGRLMQGTPPDSSLAEAWWFAAVTIFLALSTAFVPGILFMVLMTGVAAGGGAPPVWSIVLPMVVAFFFAFVLFLVIAMIWALVTHVLLCITGGSPGPLRRTCQAICYSSGAFITTAVPCLGQYIGATWWVVSAVLAVKEAHKVGGGRAAFAVLGFPVGMIALLVGGYVLLIAMMVSAPGAFGVSAAVTTAQTQKILDAVIAHAGSHGGKGPEHAILLVASGALAPWDVVDGTSATGPWNVPAGGGSVDDFASMTPEAQEKAAAAEAARLPLDVVAHRVGDHVFTYHGIDLLVVADPGLWVVVSSPDPDANPGNWSSAIAVGRADGTVAWIPATRFQSELLLQNALRQANGLPAIPDPAGVTHASPAGAEGP